MWKIDRIGAACAGVSKKREAIELAVKFDGDLGRRFLDGASNFFNGVGQPIGVDIYSYGTTWANHMLLRF
jgi:hypothetical protein